MKSHSRGEVETTRTGWPNGARSFQNQQQDFISEEPVSAVHTNEQSVGRHYTPAVIARLAVVEAMRLLGESRGETSSGQPLLALDPACGEGVFLAELYRLLRSDNANGSLSCEHDCRSLYGVDRDAAAVARCRKRIQQIAVSQHFTDITADVELDGVLRAEHRAW